ncbi:hypothetical protein [Candidatus Tisiphia endosymbiont of Hybos culiciformis]|uniref:hypothetical protein n=1 Tax=Candidatus Tisiphia endosymbiont of Hybos culiciformis TaxID=3139331 RepID=UPI003CCB67C0
MVYNAIIANQINTTPSLRVGISLRSNPFLVTFWIASSLLKQLLANRQRSYLKP